MSPELSIIVPVLNEAAVLPKIFRSLAAQRDVVLEMLVCDGGSSDGTPDIAGSLAREAPFPVRILTAETGRPQQMNAGAAAAASETLLFLHADSLFPDPLALRKGLDLLSRTMTQHDEPVAGRFALRFSGTDSRSAAYYHLECKARLDRPGCIHGDQGFLLARSLFAEAGPFAADFPMLAETRLADKLRRAGRWLLLPAEIHTSSRRFRQEGVRERQTVNAVIMNFAAAGWRDFFLRMPDLYPGSGRGGRLHIASFLRRTGQLMKSLPWRNRLQLWLATGRYVRDNAWQIPLLLDTRRNFRRGLPPGDGNLTCLAVYDRYLDRLTDHLPGRLATALVVRIWFTLSCCRD